MLCSYRKGNLYILLQQRAEKCASWPDTAHGVSTFGQVFSSVAKTCCTGHCKIRWWKYIHNSMSRPSESQHSTTEQLIRDVKYKR